MPSKPPLRGLAAPPIDLKRLLEPFAEAFETIMVAQASTRGRTGPNRVAKLASALEETINSELGHPVHPVITCFALKICCHFYHQEAEKLRQNVEWRRQQQILDRIWKLIAKLEEHYDVYELKVLTY